MRSYSTEAKDTERRDAVAAHGSIIVIILLVLLGFSCYTDTIGRIWWYHGIAYRDSNLSFFDYYPPPHQKYDMMHCSTMIS